jgi:hypothetical protein
MSKIRIYDGITIDMATSDVIEYGEVSYVDSKDIAHLGGGGTSTSTSGFAQEFKPQITKMLGEAQSLYDGGELGSVAGFNQTQLDAQKQGVAAAGNQTALEGSILEQANQGVDLSGMRTAAKTNALSALGMNAGNASQYGSLGGSRQMINNQSVANDLAGKFATIDQQEQSTNFANKQAALGIQGTGASTLAGIGSGQQQQAQNQADSAYKGLSQLASVYHGVMPKETTTTSSGK